MATNDGLNNSLAGQTGTGQYVGDTNAILVTPNIGAATGTSINLSSSTTINGAIDDDTMATASASTVATSESIKAYVDTQVAGAGGGLQSVQVFTSSGTWTRPSGITKVFVLCQGAGGGGGGAFSTEAIAGGGASGGLGQKLVDVSAIPSVTVTVGSGGAGGVGDNNGSTGGTSSFGAHVSATGGVGGIRTNSTGQTGGSGTGDTGPLGGTATGGDVNVAGNSGNRGTFAMNTAADPTFSRIGATGQGANSTFGGGGQRGLLGGSGYAARGYGAGGGGGYCNSTPARNGGAGSGGIVIVYEY